MEEIKILCRHDELMDIAELLKRQNPKNRNKHKDAQVDQLAKIYQYVGVRSPIVISKRSNQIVCGHGRLLAAIKCQMPHFPVEYQDYESDDAEYAHGISDNAIALQAELDLAAINADLPELHLPSIEVLGIEDFTVDISEKTEPQECEKCTSCGQKIKPKLN